MSRPELERLLLEGSILSAEELSVAGAHASSSGMTLETAIVALGSADERDVYKCVAKAHGLAFGDPAKATKDAMDLLPPEQIEQKSDGDMGRVEAGQPLWKRLDQGISDS